MGGRESNHSCGGIILVIPEYCPQGTVLVT
jgi:hypothetical protein